MRAVALLVVMWAWQGAMGVEEIFASKSTSPASGVVLDIAARNRTYSPWEPVTIFCCFRNLNDRDSVVVLDPNSLTVVVSRPFGKASRSPHVSLPCGCWVVPSRGEARFLVYLGLIPLGKTTIEMRYFRANRGQVDNLAGLDVCEGTPQSNRLEVEVVPKEPLTSEDKSQIGILVQDYLDRMVHNVVSDMDRMNCGVHATGRYAIPPLLEALEDPNHNKIAFARSMLCRICEMHEDDSPIVPAEITNDSVLLAFIAAYERESDVAVKDNYLLSIPRFKGVSPETRSVVVRTLIETLNNQSDQSLRRSAAVALLGFSEVDGLREVLGKIDRLKDPSYFGPYRKHVIYGLSQVKTENTQSEDSRMVWWYSHSPDEMKVWWDTNKDRLEAEAKLPRVVPDALDGDAEAAGASPKQGSEKLAPAQPTDSNSPRPGLRMGKAKPKKN